MTSLLSPYLSRVDFAGLEERSWWLDSRLAWDRYVQSLLLFPELLCQSHLLLLVMGNLCVGEEGD